MLSFSARALPMMRPPLPNCRPMLITICSISCYFEGSSGRLNGLSSSLLNFFISRLSKTNDNIVDKPSEALVILQKAGFTVSQTSVIALAIPDKPGTLDKALAVLSENNISLEYLYAFVGRASSDAVVVIRVDSAEEALSYFHANGIKVLSPEEVYGI